MRRELSKLTKFNKQSLLLLIRYGLAASVGILISQVSLAFLESWTLDLRMVYRPREPISQELALVAIDAKTLQATNEVPNAEQQRQVLEKILAAEPTKLIYFFNLSQITGTQAEKEALAHTLENPRVWVAVDELASPGRDELRQKPPFENVRGVAAPTTMDKVLLAKDGVTRRMILNYQGVNTYQLDLLNELTGLGLDSVGGQFHLISSEQAYINFHPIGSYKPISFLDLAKDQINSSLLTGRVVLFGKAANDSVEDYVMSPFAKDSPRLSVLELNANSIDTVLQDRAPRQMPNSTRTILSVLFCLLTVYVVMNLRPLNGLFTLASSVIGFVFLTWLGFALFHIWVPVSHPLLATFVCYYFFIPYRLIMENRRSWEYQEKNRLLTQVEELKSNFMRMMSHDLKTPLARIQGMATMVLSDTNPLSGDQRRALESIVRSSDDLADFIGSILSLGRIESKEIKLQLRSRDINSLLNDVIRKCEFLSRRRQIEVLTEFEPMFSFKVDEDLIRQVFTNLIENAIKYSEPQSKILISTEEIEGQVLIQVADQGHGIASQDLPHVFDKFYRSQHARESTVTGSGLGLYLVKYFVELHKGRVEVESVPEKGSTFSVYLPMITDSLTRERAKQGEIHV